MVVLADKENCTGCGACQAVCPYGAIQMIKSAEGFAYPQISSGKCIECGACEATCPVININTPGDLRKVLAAKSKNEEERKESSSGGIFSVLAKGVLQQGGVVYGAAFDDALAVEQVRIDTVADLDKLRGSKYVQSDMKKVYGALKKDLNTGRRVLFVGTPCQIDGVQAFVRQQGLPAGQLYCAALICHGVSSPGVWQDYLDTIEQETSGRPIFATFRGKEEGWHARIAIRYQLPQQEAIKDPRFTECFLSNEILRPGCYNCHYTTPYRNADLTLGDFWGIENTSHREMDDDLGVSLILCHTEKGEKLLNIIQDEIEQQEATVEEALANQRTLNSPFERPGNRDEFWNDYFAGGLPLVVHKYISQDPLDAYLDAVHLTTGQRVVVLPDGTGSKGDEALLRGVLNVMKGTQNLVLLTPRKELWRDVVTDRTLEFTEYYVSVNQLQKQLARPLDLVVVGTDVIDGTCGLEDSLGRLKAVAAAAKAGSTVRVFCSFRSDVKEEILEEIAGLPQTVQFYLRDMLSLENFNKLTGRKGEYFPDFAFFCETQKSLLTEDYTAQIKEAKAGGSTVVGLNFGEPSFRSFYAEHTPAMRAKYVETVLRSICEEIPSARIWLISHDYRHWNGYFSDADYQNLTMQVAENIGCSERVTLIPARTSHAELLEILPEFDMVVTGRMHLSVASMRSGIVPIVYTGASKDGKFSMIEKVRGMLQSRLGRGDLAATSLNQLRAALRMVNQDRETLKQTLQQNNRINMEKDSAYGAMFAPTQAKPETQQSEQILYQEMLMRTAESIHQLREDQNTEQAIKQRLFENEKANLHGHIEQLIESERRLNAQIGNLEEQLQDQVESTNAKIVELYQQKQALDELRNSIAGLNNQIQQLQQPMLSLNAIYASRTWRYSHKLATMARRVCPAGSLRARVAGAIVRVPLRFEHWVRSLPAKRRAKKEQKYYFERLAPITLPQSEEPLVSIVIPVYNQFPFTYNCLRTIAAECAGMEYEVILADDNSTDETCRITEKVSGLIISRNAENQRFLRNCNNAAQLARGKYVMFLNNDTEVQPEWLQSLCETIEADDSIGMVGSKLIYANGQLQEAGGILWADGSAWNYGHGDDPEKSEYNYVKEVDYISGCSMMIRRSLWEEIGGFDERFVPAYCEDSDLAFEVRAHGYKVIYQPKSVVVHHEGISNGTDTSCGQKQYQVVNAKKFYEKWQSVLGDDQFEHAKNVFCARDRSCGKPCVLFIDHYTPTYDQDAGSRTVFEYLRLFVQMGYNVKFIPDNFYRMPKYCEALQQLGIEVLYGPEYAQHWKEWVIENKEAIKFVFTNRPHISIKYMDFLRKKTNAKIAYYGHDLHFLRELREYELTGDKTKLESSSKWKAIEFALMRKADVAYYPSKIEQDIIHESDPSINVKVLVPYIFSEVTTPDYVLEEREDIMFLGGFNHGPNVDAALWFAKEILPLVQEKLPKVRWHVLGSHPPKEVQALASDTIKVHGFVTDEELAEFYGDCRMSVVPLRYGAGIKGKVVEAMKFGIPVLTTSVGAEGILGAENSLAVEDDPQAFADRLCSLYEDKSALRAMSAASCEYIRTQYGPENAMNLIKEDFT